MEGIPVIARFKKLFVDLEDNLGDAISMSLKT